MAGHGLRGSFAASLIFVGGGRYFGLHLDIADAHRGEFFVCFSGTLHLVWPNDPDRSGAAGVFGVDMPCVLGLAPLPFLCLLPLWLVAEPSRCSFLVHSCRAPLTQILPCQWSLDAESASLCAAWSGRCVATVLRAGCGFLRCGSIGLSVVCHLLVVEVAHALGHRPWRLKHRCPSWPAAPGLFLRLSSMLHQVPSLYNSPPVCDPRQSIVDVGLGTFSWDLFGVAELLDVCAGARSISGDRICTPR